MKPGKHDKKIKVMITGEELDELQEWVWMMSESFGLDRRIGDYRGKRPIGLYSWDFECLLGVLDYVLNNPKYLPDPSSQRYKSLQQLQQRLQQEFDMNFPPRRSPVILRAKSGD